MRYLLVVVGLLAVASCSTPAPSPKTYQEPGLSAFCATHPGKGLCP